MQTALRPMLAILTREPKPGRAKTRLAESVGADAAAQLAEAFLVDVTAQTASTGWHSVLFVEPPEAASKLSELTGVSETRAQAAGSIGARMAAAAAQLVEQNADAVLLVGSDIPLLGAALIEDALRLLADNDVVFGPARDGGYYLVALGAATLEARAFDALFDDDAVPWSTSAVLEASERIARARGWSVARIAARSDIDTSADLTALQAELGGAAPSMALRTRAVLASLKGECASGE